MKLLEIFLTEKYLNLFNDKDKEEILPEILPSIEKTYKDLGGIGNYSKESLIKVSGLWKLVKKDKSIVAGILYKDLHGRKIRLVFYDGSRIGKYFLKKILHDDVYFGRSWVECCDPLESCLLKMGAKMISADKCEPLLKQKPSKIYSDGFHYEREVSPGEFKKQILLGTII